jgi:hypothetical protein
LRDWLGDCLRDGLVFADGDTYVALATRDVPVRVVPADQADQEPVAAGR